ncbi:MAG: glycosyltransferase family 2 protein [Variovorax sp.]|nr:glycosyltransferase family 2 protein [Variovorax sp.]
MPEFSVVIPCYKQAHLLAAAIESALAQARDVDVEVIVVDDGSPDNASEVATRYEGVIVIRQPNAGLCAARNRGILRSSGKFLLFLDSDDYLRPGMLAAAARAFAESDELDVVHGYADVVDEAEKRSSGNSADRTSAATRCTGSSSRTSVLRTPSSCDARCSRRSASSMSACVPAKTGTCGFASPGAAASSGSRATCAASIAWCPAA